MQTKLFLWNKISFYNVRRITQRTSIFRQFQSDPGKGVQILHNTKSLLPLIIDTFPTNINWKLDSMDASGALCDYGNDFQQWNVNQNRAVLWKARSAASAAAATKRSFHSLLSDDMNDDFLQGKIHCYDSGHCLAFFKSIGTSTTARQTVSHWSGVKNWVVVPFATFSLTISIAVADALR